VICGQDGPGGLGSLAEGPRRGAAECPGEGP
jgi:hypothetical protein